MNWYAPINAHLEIILIFYISPYIRFDDQVATIRGSLVQSPHKQPYVKNTGLRTLAKFCCHCTLEYVSSHYMLKYDGLKSLGFLDTLCTCL
jgi:hypothetical protein